jgi:hypothetical protein
MSDPWGLAEDLKNRVATQLDALATDDWTTPAARYVAPGDSTTIAYDEPAVMVSLDQLYEGQPGQDRSQQPTYPTMMLSARYSVTIAREAAVQNDDGTAPSTDRIQADAQTLITDMAMIRQVLVNIKAESQRGGGWVGPGVPVALGAVVPVGPQGGLMAAVGVIHTQVV